MQRLVVALVAVVVMARGSLQHSRHLLQPGGACPVRPCFATSIIAQCEGGARMGMSKTITLRLCFPLFKLVLPPS